MQPLRAKSTARQQVAKTATIPAPTAGWYVGDNQATPPPKTAIVFDNAFPQIDYVRVRGGSQQWASGMSGTVLSLMPWTNGVNSKLFAVSNGSIYDVSSSGPVGAASVTGLSNSYMIFTQFAGFGGTYLVAVNGANSVQIFDGTGWNRTYVYTGTLASGTPTVTGMSSTVNLQNGMAVSGTGIPAGTTILNIVGTTLTLSANATLNGLQTLTFYQNAPITGYSGTGFSYVWQFKGRLYFVDASTATVYYLGLASIGGAATAYPLAAYFTFGGYIMCGGSWAINATSGIYESWVVVSSEGEVLMFDGDYPGAANWELKGRYKISRPLGPNCLMKAGGDLAIMTEDGIVAMSQVQQLDQAALQNVAVTKPIAPAWRNAVLARTNIPGWQIVPWPIQSMAIVNLPKQTTTDYTQYIANSRTGAWARYVGWDANCFAVFNENLFYGTSSGSVMQGETGSSDAGTTNYTATIMLGFSQLGAPTDLKQVRMVKPYIQTSSLTNPQVTINVDYNITVPLAPSPAVTTGVTPLWDSAIWDSSVWGGALVPQNVWVDAQGIGTAIAICYQITFGGSGSTPDVRLAAFDVMYEPGGIGLG